MNFDPNELKALAGVLLTKGAPILGSIIGGPVGPVLTYVVPQIATAFGLAPDATPAVIAQAVAADTGAADKLAALEEDHKADQAYLDSQIAADVALVSIGSTFWQKFIVAGPRPMMMWVSGPLMLLYEMVALYMHRDGVPFEFFVATQATFASLAGIRTVEKWKGVATMAITGVRR